MATDDESSDTGLAYGQAPTESLDGTSPPILPPTTLFLVVQVHLGDNLDSHPLLITFGDITFGEYFVGFIDFFSQELGTESMHEGEKARLRLLSQTLVLVQLRRSLGKLIDEQLHQIESGASHSTCVR